MKLKPCVLVAGTGFQPVALGLSDGKPKIISIFGTQDNAKIKKAPSP